MIRGMLVQHARGLSQCDRADEAATGLEPMQHAAGGIGVAALQRSDDEVALRRQLGTEQAAHGLDVFAAPAHRAQGGVIVPIRRGRSTKQGGEGAMPGLDG